MSRTERKGEPTPVADLRAWSMVIQRLTPIS